MTIEEAQRIILACDAGLRYEPESRRDPFDAWIALMEAVEALCPSVLAGMQISDGWGVQVVRSLPLIGVNTFLPKEHGGDITTTIELIRSTEEEKGQQIANVEGYRANRNALAPEGLKRLQQAARDRENVFAQLMEAIKYNSEGQISHALYDVGGEYRRNM